MNQFFWFPTHPTQADSRIECVGRRLFAGPTDLLANRPQVLFKRDAVIAAPAILRQPRITLTLVLYW